VSDESKIEAEERAGAHELPYHELLLGCGRARDKRIHVPGLPQRGWQALITLDVNPNVDADLHCDLNAQPPWHAWEHESRVTYELLSDYWNEIHAYEVLEHLGQQGDAKALLGQFSEIWRLLKPNGYLCATVPSRFSPWLWGDPSHRRAIVPETLVFLDQAQYQIQIDQLAAGRISPMSDFRDTCGYRADFKLIDSHDNRTTFSFILQAIKPSRYKERI
jgi:SAM-dependent methyltransferase